MADIIDKVLIRRRGRLVTADREVVEYCKKRAKDRKGGMRSSSTTSSKAPSLPQDKK